MNEPADVLLIEDNPGDADLVRMRLIEGSTPVNVNCVNRLADALATLDAKPPSVVLLDLNLPDSHGPETFRKILAKAPDVPVVILSGLEDESLAVTAIHQGVQDYLVKGDMTSRNLERSVRYAMERQSLLRSLEMSRKQQLEFKNRFLSHVSHELRTPLTCIHQYASLLFDGLAGPLSGEQRSHLQTVLKSVDQLHAMIRDLLEATRAESGKLNVEPRCLALVELLRQAIAMVRPSADKKRITIELVSDPDIPLVHGDPDRILEIVMNLLDNAIKFTDPGGRVIVWANALASDPDFVYISVADTGRGISREAIPLIFERLYQDPDAIDGGRSGLGLGLYIAKELVTLHGGRIWVASEPGEGTTFTFNLPVYCLSRLLMPVITDKEKLREPLILLRVDLRAGAAFDAGSRRQRCRETFDVLQHRVFDKALVLPPMATNDPRQTFFVVASTDMSQVAILENRIKQQLTAVGPVKAEPLVEVSARPVPVVLTDGIWSLEEQVEAVAQTITYMIVHQLAGRPESGEPEMEPKYAN